MGDAMSGTPDDDEVDLGISLEAVAMVADHARALQGREETDAAEDETSEAALRAVIAELNEDEQASLVALAWIGRGDHGPEEWEEARALAAERNEGRDPSDELLAMDNLGDLLAEGVAAFGLSIEDVER